MWTFMSALQEPPFVYGKINVSMAKAALLTYADFGGKIIL